MLVGLTGGIGGGKSTVLEFFKRQGAFVQDADALVKEALSEKHGPVLKKIRRAFGPGYFAKNGGLDRAKMAGLVFRDKAARRVLERIVHPEVRRRMRANLSRRKGTIAVCDIPLLFESGWTGDFDAIVVVDAPKAVRLRRLLKKGFSKKDVAARMRSQWPMAKKKARADFLIKNEGSKMNTKKQVQRIWNQLNDREGV